MIQLSAQKAEEHLENLCSRSERCSAEVVQKLRQWGVSSAEARAILERLIKRRFVDDARFTAAFVRDKAVYNRWGRIKIRLALRQKRIDDQLIADAIGTEIDEQAYMQTLTDLLRAKARSMGEGNTFDNRTRLMRFAASRGFEPALIATALKNPQIWGEGEEEG